MADRLIQSPEAELESGRTVAAALQADDGGSWPWHAADAFALPAEAGPDGWWAASSTAPVAAEKGSGAGGFPPWYPAMSNPSKSKVRMMTQTMMAGAMEPAPPDLRVPSMGRHKRSDEIYLPRPRDPRSWGFSRLSLRVDRSGRGFGLRRWVCAKTPLARLVQPAAWLDDSAGIVAPQSLRAPVTAGTAGRRWIPPPGTFPLGRHTRRSVSRWTRRCRRHDGTLVGS